MTGADMAGAVIDRLLERRYGAPYSAKWWARRHEQDHDSLYGFVELACPHCPDAAELGRQIRQGVAKPMSYNDFRQAIECRIECR